MRFLSHLLFAALSCFFTFAGHSQAPAWNSLRYGKVSLNYPPTWRTTKESHGGQTHATLTPDSMRTLSMRIIEIYEVPLGGDHTYARFKKDFVAILSSQSDGSTKVLKSEEISFKGHKTMYAEIIRSSLPAKLYAINAGSRIYLVFLLLSRHVNIPDPKLEKEEKAILNSITIDQ
jgi:hypothetical protein